MIMQISRDRSCSKVDRLLTIFFLFRRRETNDLRQVLYATQHKVSASKKKICVGSLSRPVRLSWNNRFSEEILDIHRGLLSAFQD